MMKKILPNIIVINEQSQSSSMSSENEVWKLPDHNIRLKTFTKNNRTDVSQNQSLSNMSGSQHSPKVKIIWSQLVDDQPQIVNNFEPQHSQQFKIETQKIYDNKDILAQQTSEKEKQNEINNLRQNLPQNENIQKKQDEHQKQINQELSILTLEHQPIVEPLVQSQAFQQPEINQENVDHDKIVDKDLEFQRNFYKAFDQIQIRVTEYKEDAKFDHEPVCTVINQTASKSSKKSKRAQNKALQAKTATSSNERFKKYLDGLFKREFRDKKKDVEAKKNLKAARKSCQNYVMSLGTQIIEISDEESRQFSPENDIELRTELKQHIPNQATPPS